MHRDLLRAPIGMGTLLSALVCCSVLVGCDMFGTEDAFDVPPERLVAMTAVYEDTLQGGRHIHRLVVADVENPSNYDVVSAAGKDVGRSCFGPEKRRLVFEDNSELIVSSRAAIKLLDLKTRTVKPLNAIGTLKGCVWRKDGSGFYYAAAGGAGLRIATFYDLESGEGEPFAQSETRAALLPYGRKGQDSILVLSNEGGDTDSTHIPFYFVDAKTGTYLTRIENEHLQFVPWEDPERAGWRYSAFVPAYHDARNLLAFRRNTPDGNSKLTVTDLGGTFVDVYGHVFGAPEWGPDGEVLFSRKRSVLGVSAESGERRTLVETTEMKGVTELRHPAF